MPEGYGLDPRDAAWWSLLVRRAETGVQALRELARLSYLAAQDPAERTQRASGAAAAAEVDAGGLSHLKQSRETQGGRT